MKLVLGMVSFLFAMFWVLFFGTSGLVMLIDDSHCVGTVKGKIFYDGPAYRLSCRSAGDATKCTVGLSGLLHDIPLTHIVSKNIEVECR